jgi:hypothetical protein
MLTGGISKKKRDQKEEMEKSNDRYVRQPKLFVEWPGSHNPGKSLCAHEKG